MLRFTRRAVPAALFVFALVAGAALTSGAQSGGIVKTQFKQFTIEPGPEPDLTLFATGECIGKIEPCG